MLFIYYPKCSTCIKAKTFLDEHNIEYIARDIKKDNPKDYELKKWNNESDLDIKSFFNTSGLVYKSLNLKDRLNNMSLDEKLKVLSSDGMLVKRPLLIGDKFILIGFKEDKWKKVLLNNE